MQGGPQRSQTAREYDKEAYDADRPNGSNTGRVTMSTDQMGSAH